MLCFGLFQLLNGNSPLSKSQSRSPGTKTGAVTKTRSSDLFTINPSFFIAVINLQPPIK